MLETSCYQISHNLNGSITVTYTPTTPGVHKVIIQHDGFMCEGFPLCCSVQKFGNDYITSYETSSSEDSDLCKLIRHTIDEGTVTEMGNVDMTAQEEAAETGMTESDVQPSLDTGLPECQDSNLDLIAASCGIVNSAVHVVEDTPVIQELIKETTSDISQNDAVFHNIKFYPLQSEQSSEEPPPHVTCETEGSDAAKDVPKMVTENEQAQRTAVPVLTEEALGEEAETLQEVKQEGISQQEVTSHEQGLEVTSQQEVTSHKQGQGMEQSQEVTSQEQGHVITTPTEKGETPSLEQGQEDPEDMEVDTGDSDNGESEDEEESSPGSRQVSKIRKSLEKYKLPCRKDGARTKVSIVCCGLKFASFELLQQHIEVKHKNDKDSEESSKKGKKRGSIPEAGSRRRLRRKAACGKNHLGETMEEVLNSIDSVHCPLCRKVCVSVQCVKKHVKAEHSKDIGPKRKQSRSKVETVLCTVCKKKFSKDNYTKHMEEVHNIIDENSTTSIHAKNPETQKDMQQVCPYCGLIYSRGNLKTHIERKHQNRERTFECTEQDCGKKFKLKIDLKRHILKMHENKNSYVCEFCAKEFKKKESVQEHVASVHHDFKPILCTVEGCSKTFPTELKLKAHVRNVHGPKESVVCSFEGCGKTLADKRSYKMHMMAHEGYRWLCPEDGCSSQFTQKHVLMRHIASKHRMTEERFTCPVAECGKKFKFKDSLRAHVRSHATSRDYVCQICQKGFKTNQMLTSHSRIHDKERQYACEICGRSYPRRYRLIDHLTKSHPDVIIQIPS